MNGGNCQKCSSSPWVRTANDYIKNPSNRRARVETVKFLLQNGFCGIDHRIGIDAIRWHLKKIGFDYGRSKFQEQILTELKRRGIVATLVYPGGMGGVFIPCNENEIKRVCQQVFRRVIQELTNLEGCVRTAQLSHTVSSAKQQMEKAKAQI